MRHWKDSESSLPCYRSQHVYGVGSKLVVPIMTTKCGPSMFEKGPVWSCASGRKPCNEAIPSLWPRLLKMHILVPSFSTEYFSHFCGLSSAFSVEASLCSLLAFAKHFLQEEQALSAVSFALGLWFPACWAEDGATNFPIFIRTACDSELFFFFF